MSSKKMPSLRWLYILLIMAACVAMSAPLQAKPASIPKSSIERISDKTKTDIKPDKIINTIKIGDTLITILSDNGISQADAIKALKKADKKVVKGIRPGGKIILKMNNSGRSVSRIEYNSPASKRAIIYSGSGLRINPEMKKVNNDSDQSRQKLLELSSGKLNSIPGVNPDMSYEEGLMPGETSVFNLPTEERTRIIKSARVESERIYKQKQEKLNQLRLLKKKENEKKRLSVLKKHKQTKNSLIVSREKRSVYKQEENWQDYDVFNENSSYSVNDEDPNLGEQIASIADKYKGTPYRRGQASSSGTDCSGLTLQVFKDMGVKLPRSSRDQFRVGVPKKKDQLTKGDLVFFSTSSQYKKIKIRSKKNPKKKIVKYVKAPRRITHVGIYVGDGKFIHAPRSGYSVKVESLDSDYYRKNYVGARSVVQ